MKKEPKRSEREDQPEVGEVVTEEPALDSVSEETERTDTLDEENRSENREDDEPETVESETEQLRMELCQLSDKHMRLMAEYDNFRRRTRQEKEALYADSVIDVVTDWLPVIDNLERALAAAGQVEENDVIAQFRQGVEMVLKQACDTLNKEGVKKIEALGQTFDPNLHSAVLHIDDEAYGEQEIVEELETGYIRGDRVIRHSIVKVAN
ncbi:MAG: nucleotide exchange factor GrpE [Fastidiosipilaceae bacterium]|jgi:molecular chaperone GrpE